jgi:hypothetical protein
MYSLSRANGLSTKTTKTTKSTKEDHEDLLVLRLRVLLRGLRPFVVSVKAREPFFGSA